MKKLLGMGMIALMMSSCLVVKVPPGQAKKTSSPAPAQSTKSNPPGQVKKTTGSQSAAPYAPGQQKKAGQKKN